MDRTQENGQKLWIDFSCMCWSRVSSIMEYLRPDKFVLFVSRSSYHLSRGLIFHFSFYSVSLLKVASISRCRWGRAKKGHLLAVPGSSSLFTWGTKALISYWWCDIRWTYELPLLATWTFSLLMDFTVSPAEPKIRIAFTLPYILVTSWWISRC